MEHSGLILTLAMGFSLALAFGYLTQKLRLSPIVGYLLASVGSFLGRIPKKCKKMTIDFFGSHDIWWYR
jgi:Kef-type K+ transport system membrane component KefB